MQNIVIVGASSAIAEHCVRRWVSSAAVIHLVGRDAQRLEVVAADLRVRGPGTVVHIDTLDFEAPLAIASLADRIDVETGGVDLVLVAHGSLPDQAKCQADLREGDRAIRVNALSPVLFAEAFAACMARRGKGTLAVIGSVAGDRGRQSNYVYGAAKALVATYLEGLRHRFAGTAVRIVVIKPGPTDTPMTAHLKGGKLKLAPVEDVARTIVRGIEAGRAEIYAPAKWRLIMFVMRHLPRFVFDKLRV